MTRILFVDDEAPVLEGLRTRLYRDSGRWTMVFVDSGARAIAELEEEAFDVIVTDMRMPGMDGAELLQNVSERWPQSIRIVLSGYAELQQVLRLVPVAHQYLSKPCDTQRLVSAINGCLHLHTLLPHAELRGLVGRVRTLPVMPDVYSELRVALSRENVDVQEIAQLLTSEPVMAAKVLQMANSAFFRLARPTVSINQAVSYLGVPAIRNLITSPSIFSPSPNRCPSTLVNFEQLLSHSHAAAAAAQGLATSLSRGDEALLAGLLHNIGYWVLAHECPGRLADAVEMAAAEHIPLYEAEARVLGSSHAQIGAYLLGLWGLPLPIVEAVAYHHAPHSISQSKFEPLAALAVANALLPTDDTNAFGATLVSGLKVDSTFLSRVNAPFDWAEAAQRVAKTVCTAKL
jgi:HD-like signal output (HDOD) protein/ActR/RegA family two-component response regulator